MTICPIETTYRGHRFRSRLEARWAVFFDQMDIEYWYEPEGFQFLDGSRYLPDFYFPQLQMFGEVKPDLPTDQERRKAESLCRATHKNIILLTGPPAARTYESAFWDCEEVTYTDVLLDIHFHNRKFYRLGRLFACTNGQFSDEHMTFDQFSTRFQIAVYASRAARFE